MKKHSNQINTLWCNKEKGSRFTDSLRANENRDFRSWCKTNKDSDDILSINLLWNRLWVLVKKRLTDWGDSNEYSKSMFYSKRKRRRICCIILLTSLVLYKIGCKWGSTLQHYRNMFTLTFGILWFFFRCSVHKTKERSSGSDQAGCDASFGTQSGLILSIYDLWYVICQSIFTFCFQFINF